MNLHLLGPVLWIEQAAKSVVPVNAFSPGEYVGGARAGDYVCAWLGHRPSAEESDSYDMLPISGIRKELADPLAE